ncbi:hypothetical protein IT570_03390 [Candidatus Sumerlaeota bacterium]|nr:hypothetical protein [Candidatus Sumerlaeota bacterium]
MRKTAIQLIAEERERQIKKEGFDAERDDACAPGVLIRAGLCYLIHGANMLLMNQRTKSRPVSWWPFSPKWWKPTYDPARCLVKGGALIAAELDRYLRQEEAHAKKRVRGLVNFDTKKGS